jgi:iron complex outermembrane receptor protein
MRRQTIRTAVVAGLAAAGTIGAAAGASAQETTPPRPEAPSAASSVDAVIVTARRREENIQNVPIAVTAIPAQTLREQRIATGLDLQYAAPSLSLSGARSHQNGSYAIRGLGQVTLAGPSVVNYFAELPSPVVTSSGDTGAGQAIFDLSSVQVLKGPQGTLFGRTATAGAILYTPQHPIFNEFSGFVDTTVGSYGRVQATAAVNIPLGDHLAMRLAVHRDHVDGYTRIIGGGAPLDETNNVAFRAGLEFRAGALRNYAAADYFRADETGAANVLSGINVGAASLNRTAANFAAICTTALTFPVGSLGANVDNSSLANCEAQRVGILAGLRNTLVSEQARLAASEDAVHFTRPQASPILDRNYHLTFVDIAQVDFAGFGLGEMSLKNIFGYQLTRQLVSFVGAGIGGLNDSAYGTSASSQPVGNGRRLSEGPNNRFYSDEVQLNGNVGHGALIYTLGYFYQYAPVTANTAGVNNLFQQFGGVSTVNLGWLGAAAFLTGGHANEKAWFGQATLDLSHFGLNGVHLTAGYRRSEDFTTQTTAALVTNYPSGTITPGAAGLTTISNSGVGWTFSVDYEPTRYLTLYATTRRGYKPGGINVNSPPAGHETYGPETITDYEVGVKTQFNAAGLHGHLYADLYRDDYSSIQRSLRLSGAVAYVDNVAAARLQGAEIEGALATDNGWRVDGSYSFNDARYTRYLATDPLSVAPLGTILDLSNNPFANAPRHKFSLTVGYTRELPSNLGEVSVAATLYHQSLVWFDDTAQRNIDVLGPTLGAAYVAGALSQPAYTVVNLRADWRHIHGSNLDAGIFVSNLTDEVYAFGGISALVTVGLAQKYYAPPRMFGVQLSYHFGD